MRRSQKMPLDDSVIAGRHCNAIMHLLSAPVAPVLVSSATSDAATAQQEI